MQRQEALDGARGFAVLFIPATHCFLVYGQPYTHHSIPAYLLRAVAEGPGVAVFLLIMGIVITFKESQSFTKVIKRAAVLLLAGYLLNALKFVFPFLCTGLPDALHHDLNLTPGQEMMQLLLLGDIFHAAAIMLVITHAVYRTRNYWFWSLWFAAMFIIVSPLLPSHNTHYVMNLFTGAPPRIFYPVLSWLPYPLIGLTIGYGLRRRKNATLRYMGIIGFITTITSVTILVTTQNFSEYGYYRPMIIESCVHIGIVLLYLWLWYTIIHRVSNKRCMELLQFSSVHITTIYAVQWIFICWLIPFTGYQTMNLSQTGMMALYTTAVSFAITYFLTNRKYA